MPTRRTLALIATLVLVAPALAPAADAQDDVLTLAEAIALAEAGNQRIAAMDARLDAADATVDEARGQRLPRLDLAGHFQRTDNPTYVFSNLLGQEAFTAENFAVDKLNSPDALDHWTARLELSQPLWAGGQLRHAREAAENARQATGASRERTRQEVVRQVTEAYSTAVLARHQLAVAREALKTAQAHVELIADLYEGGLVVESDLLLAQVRESEVRETVIRAEAGVEVSRAALNLALGRPLGTAFTLPEDLELEAGDDVELDVLLARAVEARPDLVAARRQAEAAGSQTAMTRAVRRGEVGLHAAWESNAEDFFGNDGDNTSIVVGFKLPLWNATDRARVARARAQESEAAEMTELLERRVELEVRQAWHELLAARQRLEQARRGAELARRSLVIVEDRYKEGLDTLPSLLDAETALTGARLREVASRRDVLLARASLDLASGGRASR